MGMNKNTNGKLNVALVSTPFFGVPPPKYSGLERIVWDLAEALDRLGVKITIIAPKGSKATKRGDVIWTVDPVNQLKTNRRQNILDWRRNELDAYEIYKDRLGEFDIVHDHSWYGCVYIYKLEHPEVRVCHTHHGEPGISAKPPSAKKANIIAISDWMRGVFESLGWAAKVVHNGIDLKRYPYKPDKEDRLLFVGRISKFKRPDIAIEVAKRVDMKLDVLGGSFTLDEGYIQRIKHLCEANDFGFHLNAPHEVKVELMQNARCLLFPPDTGEPFGLVPVEAGACGTPTIAWDDGAVKETVADGVTGFVVPKTVEAMADAVKKIDGIAPVACRRRVEENFSREFMAKNYLTPYNQILAGEEW